MQDSDSPEDTTIAMTGAAGMDPVGGEHAAARRRATWRRAHQREVRWPHDDRRPAAS